MEIFTDSTDKTITSSELIAFAEDSGLKDVHLIEASLFVDVPADAKSILIGFMPYTWNKKASLGRMPLSGYYPVSNKGHDIIRSIGRFLISAGVYSEPNRTVPEKLIASHCGGTFGLNSLYYHPEYGSAVFIATLFTGVEPEKGFRPKKAELNPLCSNCGKCRKSCPVQALDDKDIKEVCLRAHMFKKPLSAEYARHIYQLMGCEVCQTVCPLNSSVPFDSDYSFDIMTLFKDRSELAQMIGRNYARKTIVLQQVIAYAANTGFKGCIDEVEALKYDPMLKPVCDYYLSLV